MVENTGASVERYMNLLSARQKLVASNIANADTPGYKTKDIDFRAELFNIFNHSQFFNPDGNSSDGTQFGQVTQSRDPRLVQFALKLFF